MDNQRLFMIGLVVLFLGIQLRLVKSYELNEQTTQFIEKRFPSDNASYTNFVSYDQYWVDPLPIAVVPRTRSISPPRWIAWSLITVGAILVLTHPCFKR